jgi:hypothetical protein
MIDQSRDLKLRAAGVEHELVVGFTILLTAKAVHSLYNFSRREWFAL